MTGHIRIVNDAVELVPLLITFNQVHHKEIYDMLIRGWMTEGELCSHYEPGVVSDCLMILRKGNLVEEKWRMPEPGKKPEREFHASYSKFRANFQCAFNELSDLLYISSSNDADLRDIAEQMESELRNGSSSINDMARKFNVSPMFIKGLAKRIPHMDVKGQGLVLLDGTR